MRWRRRLTVDEHSPVTRRSPESSTLPTEIYDKINIARTLRTVYCVSKICVCYYYLFFSILSRFCVVVFAHCLISKHVCNTISQKCHQTFVRSFAKYWPTFNFFSLAHFAAPVQKFCKSGNTEQRYGQKSVGVFWLRFMSNVVNHDGKIHGCRPIMQQLTSIVGCTKSEPMDSRSTCCAVSHRVRSMSSR